MWLCWFSRDFALFCPFLKAHLPQHLAPASHEFATHHHLSMRLFTGLSIHSVNCAVLCTCVRVWVFS